MLTTEARETRSARQAVRGRPSLVLNLGWRYTPAMKEFIVSTLFLSLALRASAQTVPAGWQVIKDTKGVCQVALTDGGGAAVFHDPSTAIAVVTSQPGQIFKPFSETQLRMLGIPKEQLFENTAKRIFYNDRAARNSPSATGYSAMGPGTNGTCCCHVVLVPTIAEEIAKKISLSLAPVKEEPQP